MAYLIEHKTQVIYVTASSVNQNGKKLKIVVESRPEFAIVRLAGARGEFPIAWKMIYEVAMRHHAENLRLEGNAERPHSRRKKKPDQ
ncbi:MAG: hypothetical protein P4L26_01040 [Terracidiphilus sp.]|jgi:hypothetical protein|nr:hypothetical protein [Terracidiphilus sp.]